MSNKIRIIPNLKKFEKINCDEIHLKGEEKKNIFKLRIYQQIEKIQLNL